MGEWSELVKTLGFPGAIVALVAAVLAKSPFLRPDHSGGRDEVLAELKALRKENAEESRAIRSEIAGVSRDVIDLKARTQENIAEHGRRLDRMERR